MLQPLCLKKGDTVAIAATARKITPEEIAPAIQLFQSWGLFVVVPEHLFDTHCQFAGTDANRAACLQQLFDNDDVRAIICARGGYGTVRIIDNIDLASFTKFPKWIVGYSDVTVLHSHIHATTGIATLHATMPINIPPDATLLPYPSLSSLHDALFLGRSRISFDATPHNRTGIVEGIVVGGNLSIIYSLCGSISDIDTEGKILFIEDLDEYLYHIDRMMRCLKRAGKLSRLKGLLVGAMSNMHDNSVPFGKNAEEIIFDAIEEYDYPVCFNVPIGHIGTENRALFLGVPTRIEIAETHCTLEQHCY